MLLRLAGMVGVWAVVGAFATGAGAADQAVMALSGPNRFSPADVTITQGDTVTFSNGGGIHNVHFDDGSVDNPPSASSSSWSFPQTFNQVGDFRYYCELHGDAGGVGMSGIVHVVAPPSGPPPENPPPGGGPPAQDPGDGGSTDPGSGGPAPGGQSPGAPLKVTLKASDTTPLAGRLVRLFGVVKPARDGRKLQIQKRLRNGKFKTIATTRLHAASGDKSTYSIKLRLAKDVVLRTRVAGDDERATGLSKTRKLDVHRAA
jgi:plastocyanin